MNLVFMDIAYYIFLQKGDLIFFITSHLPESTVPDEFWVEILLIYHMIKICN